MVAVKLTVYVPTELYVWDGFLRVEVPVSPKFQDQEVDPVDRSVKLTVRGTPPEVGVAEKLAVGGVVPPDTVMVDT